jgi:hypothetical protein
LQNPFANQFFLAPTNSKVAVVWAEELPPVVMQYSLPTKQGRLLGFSTSIDNKTLDSKQTKYQAG